MVQRYAGFIDQHSALLRSRGQTRRLRKPNSWRKIAIPLSIPFRNNQRSLTVPTAVTQLAAIDELQYEGNIPHPFLVFL